MITEKYSWFVGKSAYGRFISKFLYKFGLYVYICMNVMPLYAFMHRKDKCLKFIYYFPKLHHLYMPMHYIRFGNFRTHFLKTVYGIASHKPGNMELRPQN